MEKEIKEYGLLARTGKSTVVLNRRFKTAEEAKQWGDWNDRGHKAYIVVEIYKDDSFLATNSNK